MRALWRYFETMQSAEAFKNEIDMSNQNILNMFDVKNKINWYIQSYKTLKIIQN